MRFVVFGNLQLWSKITSNHYLVSYSIYDFGMVSAALQLLHLTGYDVQRLLVENCGSFISCFAVNTIRILENSKSTKSQKTAMAKLSSGGRISAIHLAVYWSVTDRRTDEMRFAFINKHTRDKRNNIFHRILHVSRNKLHYNCRKCLSLPTAST